MNMQSVVEPRRVGGLLLGGAVAVDLVLVVVLVGVLGRQTEVLVGEQSLETDDDAEARDEGNEADEGVRVDGDACTVSKILERV